ncbi:MAG TPA: histidine phosphatase family protein [Cyanobacteria bacterium UBA8156]|jgi:broad specificity phosphatase PhoE|nr:histidine phosphatase family protein [Cyanobacteria bacterium UBA8156]
MPQLWIARHANRQDFVDPRWFETADRPYDPPLSADGWQQARALAQRLAAAPIHRIYASPFLRTVQTAAAIAAVLGVSIRLEPGLGEWLHPDWMPANPARLSATALAAHFPIDLAYCSPATAVYPETETDLLTRTAATAQRLAALPENQLWVGHERSVFGAISGLVPTVPPVKVPLCSLSHLQKGSDCWQVLTLTDTTHL